jgi:hypothetical protein
MADDISPFTDEHAKYFGHIINIFARIETQMMVCAAGILNTDLATAYILMADTHYRQKRQTLLHLNITLGINGYREPELTAILDGIHKLSGLRNAIAHNTWVKGNRPNSIKPMQLILRGEEPTPLGHWHNEQSYTPDDLRADAIKLETLSRRLAELLETTGLEERVHAKIDAINPATSSREGSPSAK